MKLLYFECNMGAAGDMIISALAQLFPDRDLLQKEINNIGIPDTRIAFEDKSSSAIAGVHTKVFYENEEEVQGHISEHHSHTHENVSINYIYSIIDNLNVSLKVKTDAKQIYNMIAVAESSVHGCDVTQVHFHELGMMDAIADIVISAYMINKLNIDKILVSPINTGFGQVQCAHGIMPVPAPATAKILEGVKCYSGNVKGELCTPTGAAILKYFADEFCNMPSSKVLKAGYGMGTKQFSNALNCIRVFLCEKDDERTDIVTELSCNIDDMTAEDLSFACEQLLSSGALDVWQTPIIMKKTRQATLLSVLCQTEDKDKMLSLIFKHTSTIGIREKEYNRYTLLRREETIDTKYGKVKVKISDGYGVCKSKPEYEQLKKIAVDNNISIEEVRRNINK